MEIKCNNCERVECVCHLIKIIPEGSPDFKFEWAFESLTNDNSYFREISPVYDENA